LKFRTKLLWAFLLVAILPLLVVCLGLYAHTRDSQIQVISNHLESVASIQRNRIEAINAQNLERLNLVTSRTQLRISLEDYLRTADPAQQQKINRILADAKDSIADFATLSIADLGGTIVASTDPGQIGVMVVAGPWFTSGQAENRVDLFYLDPADAIKIRLSGPLLLDDHLLGVLQIESSVDNFLNSINDYTGLGDSGETVLLAIASDGQGTYLLPTRFNPEAAMRLTTRVPGTLSHHAERRIDYRQNRVLAVTRPIAKTSWLLTVKIDQAEAFQPLVELRRQLLLFGISLAGLIIGSTFFLSSRAVHSVTSLTAVAQQIAAGEEQLRAREQPADEIGALAAAFNRMTEKLLSERHKAEESARELQEAKAALAEAHEMLSIRLQERTEELQQTHTQLRHAEKLTAIGRLSASIAHEFNNPLQGVMNILKGVARRVPMSETDGQLLTMALAECVRMRDLIRNLQDFNRPTSGKRSAVDLHTILDSILVLNKKELKSREITLVKEFAEGLPRISAVADQLKQVFLNLLSNAADACRAGGTITLQTAHVGNNIRVTIEDTGQGVKPEERDHIFEPFFSTKPEVKGTGLGLPVSYGIVKDHGGTIIFDSEPGKGARFSVILPIQREAA
jgi:signal transduction histidine kinase